MADLRFKDKVAVITGGAQGIGMAISRLFALQGAISVIVDTDQEAARELQESLLTEGLKADCIQADVSKEEDILKMAGVVREKYGQAHVLINNAGIGCAKSFEDQTLDDWLHVMSVNLQGAYLCAKHLSPQMPDGAAIINIASTRALMSEANTEPYSASKGGLAALTHALAITLGPRGIRVNAISPGWIDVSNWRKESCRVQQPLTEQDHHQHPVGRVGKPEDIAEACLFLADSAKSGFITGQNLIIDGGMTVKMIYV